MIEQKTALGHRYDPLWGAAGKKKRLGSGTKVAIAISILVHAGLFYYVYETKFVVHYKEYGDQAISAEIFRPFKEPPPEPPKPEVNQAPPPVQPPPLAVRTPVPSLESFPLPPTTITVPEAPLPPPPEQTVREEPPKPQAPRTITNPDWSSRPSGDDVARFYPDRAQRLEMSGSVTLNCLVTAKGTVSGCTVLSETPADFGFGEAALKLSRLFRMKPKMEDGQAVEGAVVRIPIAFRIQ